MLLTRVIALAGIAVLSTSASDNDLGTTLSTKYIEHSPDSETTFSTSWRTNNAPSTTIIGDDDDGWTVVSETETPATDTPETPTDNSTSPQATDLRPNNAMVAHRMAMVAGATWGRFPTKPDEETEACADNSTVDDSTHNTRYNSSTVNCTALMFGDRWHRWECDEACRANLIDALPAAILFVVGPDLADSDAVQRSIQAFQQLLGQRVSFLRLGRLSLFLRQAETHLGGLFREGRADMERLTAALWEPIRSELELFARTFRLNPAATNRVVQTVWETYTIRIDITFPIVFEPPRLPDILTPEYFDTTEEYENYIRRRLETRELLRQALDRIEDPEPLLEEMYQTFPNLPEPLASRLYEEIALPQYRPTDDPPVYEDPPAYDSRDYSAEQDLYDSMSWLAESPPIQEEFQRFGRYNSWPTPIPVTNIPEPTIPVTPSIVPTIAPTDVPIPPPNTPETSRIDLAQDGTLTIAGSGAWALAAETSVTLFNLLTTCTPLDMATWTFIPRSASFLAHAKVAAWNGLGVEQCFAKEISGLPGAPSAESIVTQGFKEYDMKIELEINPTKPGTGPPNEGPGRGPPNEEGPGRGPPEEEGPGGGPPEEEGAPGEKPGKGKKLPKCTWWMIVLGYPLWGGCCMC